MKASFETLENKSFFFRFDMFWIYSNLARSRLSESYLNDID